MVQNDANVSQITIVNSCHPPTKKNEGFRRDDVPIFYDDLITMMMGMRMMMEIIVMVVINPKLVIH